MANRKFMSCVVVAALVVTGCADVPTEIEQPGEADVGQIAQPIVGAWSVFNGPLTGDSAGLWVRNQAGTTHAYKTGLRFTGLPPVSSCPTYDMTSSGWTTPTTTNCASIYGGAETTQIDLFWADGSTVRKFNQGSGTMTSLFSASTSYVGASPRPAGSPSPTVTDVWYTSGGGLYQSYRTTDTGSFVTPYWVGSVPGTVSGRPLSAVWSKDATDTVLNVFVPTTTGIRADSWRYATSTFTWSANLAPAAPASGVAAATAGNGLIFLFYIDAAGDMVWRYTGNNGGIWYPTSGGSPTTWSIGKPAAGFRSLGTGVYATPSAVFNTVTSHFEVLAIGADNNVYTYEL